MATETAKQPLATTITTPDVSRLPALPADEMLKLRVVDDMTKAKAGHYGAAANEYIASVTVLFKEPTEAANKVHKFLTGLRSKFTGTAQEVVDHCRKEIYTYDQKIERDRLALQRKLQEDEDRKARLKAEEERKIEIERLRKAQEDAALKQQEAEDDLMPWDKPDEVLFPTDVVDLQQQLLELEAAPVTFIAPQVLVPEAPKVEGVGSRNTPLKYRVADLSALVKAATENPALLEYLTVNDVMVKAKLKLVGEKIGDYVPGIEWYRDKTVRF